MAGPDEEAKPGDTGMEKGAMKKLLARARKEPVNCAMARGDAKQGGLGLLLLDKVKPPKALVRSLLEKFPDATTPCFGTASVNVDQDAKLVNFKVNKPLPGMDRRIRKTLKGTGFSKVVLSSGPAEE